MMRLVPYLPFLLQNPSVYVHVNRKEVFVTDMLERLGIAPSRVVDGHVEARLLYVPVGTPCGQPQTYQGTQLTCHTPANEMEST